MSELEQEVGILRTENLKLRNVVARLSQQTQHSQPQLTIPKSIADEIDCVVNPIGQIVLKSGILSDFTVEAISWIYKNNENGYIAIAYANPLTHDLVKVEEGIDDNY